jgi:hypothetical protein
MAGPVGLLFFVPAFGGDSINWFLAIFSGQM